MPRAKRKTPVSSFGPEIMQALLRGAKERFELVLPYREAVRFAMRINSLRRAMYDESHSEATLVQKTRVRVRWGEAGGFDKTPEKHSSRNVPFPVDREAPSRLIIEPHDSEFTEALLKAGIEADKLKSDPLADYTPVSTVPEPGSEDYLDQVLGGKKP